MQKQVKQNLLTQNFVFEQLKLNILNLCPVAFCENNLSLDGREFRLNGNGYKPFADIYRYIALKAVEPNTKPVVLVKGRQVGATTMAAALECYFMACGLYGNNNRSPMRIMHLFPTLALAAAYTKDKLHPMISASKTVPGEMKNNGQLKSIMETKMDMSSPANNSQHFKKFLDDNQIWIESTGPTGDRVRGRQLALDTELPTPNGFIKLKDLKQGNQLFDENGKVCNVTKLHPIQETPEAYKITFDDGTVIEACAEHLWLTHTKKDRRLKEKASPTIKNTKEILDTLKVYGENNHSVPMCLPVEYARKDLLIDPYLLGFWLGDGNCYGGIETADFEAFYDYEHRVVPSSTDHMGGFGQERVVNLTTQLRQLNIAYTPNPHGKMKNDEFYHKHIPDDYLHSSVEQRLALLQGLMDSDGCCTEDGSCEFIQVESRKELAFQVYELILSLGIKAFIHKRESYRYNVRYQDKYCIQFYTTLPIFKLERKLKNIKKKFVKDGKRFIKNIERIPSKPMRCITVDSPSHLYLVTRSFIPTHNTIDCAFLDECFPYDQNIEINNGKKKKIGVLYDMWKGGEELPLVKTYNEKTDEFEYKKILNAWKREERALIQLICNNGAEIKCTPNHKFLTSNGWKRAEDLRPGYLIKTNDFTKVKYTRFVLKKEIVYDIEVEDNHNFIVDELVAHNCQDYPAIAVGATVKTLAQAQYGHPGQGVQVYFGTPKQKGTWYYEMWMQSSQQYYHLNCESCDQYFPLYRPDVNWEDIWLYGFIVKCTNCGHEQNKNEAAERGRWFPLVDNEEEVQYVGYHINQLYIPRFDKETILKQKPENNAINTERIYQNEVLGEFYAGEGATVSPEDIHEKCADRDRYFASRITAQDNRRVYAGFDWGQRGDWNQLSGKQKGQSYSCGVILTAVGPQLLQIEFAHRLKRTDQEHKIEVVEEMFRRFNVHVGIGDIGDAADLTHILQRKHGDRFLASRAAANVNKHIKFTNDIFPKEIVFERDYYISEMMGLLKNGNIRFPYGNYEEVTWLIEHCCSMEIKVTQNRSGDPVRRYMKGPTPNDGLMALLNAYLAYKFDITQGFKLNHPGVMKFENATSKHRIPAIIGYLPKF